MLNKFFLVNIYLMNRENLHLIKKPAGRKAIDHLDPIGLAVEYFPAFFQQQHDFHTHEFIEMLYVIEGSFRHVTADHTYDETAGSLAILNYNQFHTLKTPDKPVELINLYWDLRKYPFPELPEPLSSRLHEMVPAHPMLGHRLNRIVHLQFEEPQKIADLLRMLYREQQEEPAGNEAAIQSIFRLFLIELCRAAPAETEHVDEHFNPRMEMVRQHLDSHYAEPVRLDQLCALSQLRKANLCRQFKKYTGLSTGDYLKQRRLAAAMQQLRTTNDKILTICCDCGFSDIAHFNRIFRTALDQTPSEYRTHAIRLQSISPTNT